MKSSIILIIIYYSLQFFLEKMEFKINYYLKIFFLLFIVCLVPFHAFSQSCAQSDNSTVTVTDNSTDLDNATYNNCVAGDVAAWAIDKVYIFTDAYCTTGKQTINISDVTTPLEVNKMDFADSPNIGSISISEGTYKCVATRMWDNITFSPYVATTSGSCVAADNYTQDICGSGTSYYDPDNSSYVDCSDSSGNSGGVGDGNEWVWVYFSTVSTDATSDGDDTDFNPPSSDNLTKGVALSGSLVVSGTKASILKTDISSHVADYKILDGSTDCGMQKPDFSFE